MIEVKGMNVYHHITRSDGLQIKIKTLLHLDNFRPLESGEYYYYSSYIEVRDKGRRKWRHVMDDGECPTSEELLAAKMALWESIRPR